MALKYIRWFLLAGLSLNLSVVWGQIPAREPLDLLSSYKWQKRILLVFAPNINNQEGAEQLKLLKKTIRNLAYRELVLIPVIENRIESKITGNITAGDLRRQFNIKPNAFTLILIGKDGGEKYRSTRVVAPAEIFNIIDAMPMRQSEMQRKN